MDLVVGISEMVVSDEPAQTLITYSLGSCVGLAVHDPVAGVGGMLHAMLPTSKANPSKAEATPAAYVDTGAAMLLQAVFDRGATRSNLVARVAGAASHVDHGNLFRIGERNYAVLRKVLWKNDILIAAEDVGGSCSRTLALEIGSGRVTVKSEGRVREL